MLDVNLDIDKDIEHVDRGRGNGHEAAVAIVNQKVCAQRTRLVCVRKWSDFRHPSGSSFLI